MANFSEIENVIFPQLILQSAFEFLRSAGANGYEAVVLFAGIQKKQKFDVMELYIPKQKSYKTSQGLMYQVEHEELYILDDWLYDNNLSLLCQMHTHPGRAYHSDADDKNCIVNTIGGISIVIPNFALEPIDPSNWAVYRLVREVGWEEVNSSDKKSLIEIV